MFEVCRRCLMPNTRPETPFEDKVCQACINFDARSQVDWKSRLNELAGICERYRRQDGSWDCVVPVSGGKDSHAIVFYMKEVMGMNPLLITVGDPFTKTKAGAKNYYNIGETFNCDQILFTVSPKALKCLVTAGFEKLLNPLLFVEQVLNTIPFKMALKFGIQLLMKGESPFIYGGSVIENKSANKRFHRKFNDFDMQFWIDQGADKEELNSIVPPKNFDGLNTYYMSYFVPWSSLKNFEIAKRYGFVDLTHEWKREGCIEDFEQIDSIAYLAHLWLKYPKFGFQRTSDIVARRIREGALTVEQGKELISKYDHKLDQCALEDFISFIGYSTNEFWSIVERFWNTEIFKKDGNFGWKMKVSRF